jgi:hypothetical protein
VGAITGRLSNWTRPAPSLMKAHHCANRNQVVGEGGATGGGNGGSGGSHGRWARVSASAGTGAPGTPGAGGFGRKRCGTAMSVPVVGLLAQAPNKEKQVRQTVESFYDSEVCWPFEPTWTNDDRQVVLRIPASSRRKPKTEPSLMLKTWDIIGFQYGLV